MGKRNAVLVRFSPTAGRNAFMKYVREEMECRALWNVAWTVEHTDGKCGWLRGDCFYIYLFLMRGAQLDGGDDSSQSVWVPR